MNKIQEFNDLHTSEEILFLGNAWDLLSALALEKAGFKAIGTTSWGIANTLGFSDGELIDFEQHVSIIRTIAEHVQIPVSADIEAGYGKDVATIVEHVLRTADVGVAGINIEDSLKQQKGLREVRAHSNLLSKIRAALDVHGFKDFFINARTDTFLQIEAPLSENIERAKAYVESGANGIFVPGLKNDEEIRKVVYHIHAPLNVLSLPGLTNVRQLQQLGVKRFSFGNAFSDKIIVALQKNAEQLINLRDTSHLYDDFANPELDEYEL
ncbi:isocitrate lyase/phosphoenolpyruvate mutase family protein [Paenibacillus sp. AK121]|uniref:isocitrate lyase/PEP mutase family protein n=1 Tax=Paenibacillus sp. AK121 TaxID=2849670 RepID=UPI001C211913|nr:isocitrate lyase/phosphoenolpyruvate mutase family protein [Paenibacillus sp. AK121]MBU9705516.1 isocitrate lyase/phosphoenolpyruvate mutase family protein [Paenibacillus sp. AK121]